MATVEAPRVEPRIAPGPFRNELATDFTQEQNKKAMRTAIEKVRSELGREYDLVIGGQRLKTKDKLRSINPANPSELVGLF
ncbi:MAG: L-glutamate gamma-semialdehyde dehydrogenase, partial [Terriglobales bacterium]